MHRIGKLKETLVNIINSDNEFSYEEKRTWSAIMSELADYQDDVLQSIASRSSGTIQKTICVQCGVTSKDEKQLDSKLHFMSLTDDITAPEFPDGITVTDEIKMDGEWFIIGTGYLDCEYEELHNLCGRDKTYTGISLEGEFEYSLVQKNNILHKEKMIYSVVDHYDYESVIFAPMLRRLVYIETRDDIKGRISAQNLQLEKNGLTCLLGGWRAVWNVELMKEPYGIKANDGYRYLIDPDEYIIVSDMVSNNLKITNEYDSAKEQEYVLVTPDDMEDPKKYLTKIRVPRINNDEDISESDMKIYAACKGGNKQISRIYSKSDVFSFLQGYTDILKCEDVYAKCPDNFKVCAYEYGYEYPDNSDYLELSDRPRLYISFINDKKKFFFDRVVYVIHILQKRFPEYIWKGGYL